MSVEEYLRIINGEFGEEKLTKDKIDVIGFVDIIPYLKDSVSRGPIEMVINEGVLSAKRTFTNSDGEEITLEKLTDLSDDIALHCDTLGSPEAVLSATAVGLKEMENMDNGKFTVGHDPLDYSPRIEAITQALQSYTQVETVPTTGIAQK